MNNRLRIGMLLLAVCLVPGSMWAQSTSSPVSPSDASPGMQGETDAQQTGTEDTLQHLSPPPAEDVSLSTNNDPAPVYVSALDGTGLISQDEALRGRLLLGVNYSGGYDTNPDGLENAPKSGAFLISPFVGLQGNRPNLHYVVQYQPTFRHYTSSSYDGGSMQVGSGNIFGRMNERWSWDGLVLGRHGQDSIGLLAPQQSVPVGDVPGTVPAANAFNPNANTITSIDGRAGLTYLVSERGTLGFKAENAYTDYAALLGNSLIGTVSTNYAHAVSPALQWLTYASATRYYGSVHCYAYGGGVGLEWRPEEHTYLHLSGGPQLDSSACGKQQGFSYQADFSRRITPRSQIYVASARQVGSTDLGPGLWQQTASIGYQLDFERRESIAFDFGYYSTTGIQSTNGYSGKYVDGIYNRVLGHGLRAIFSYRWYAGETFQSNFTRNIALLSIAWTPTAGHLFQ
jgi:hypothetical protein